MTRTRLLILFSIATLICMTAFTAVVYQGHLDAANQQDLDYLRLYVEQVNEKRRQGIPSDKIPLLHRIVNDNTYQIIVDNGKDEPEYRLNNQLWLIPANARFAIEKMKQKEQVQGNLNVGGENIHWVKLPLTNPPATIFFIHLESDHWRSFSNTFGTAIFILGGFLFWAAIWSAIILSKLFQRVQNKNDLLQTQAVEICQARDEAYAAAQTKSRFLANISHELRTPLTAILGFSENMLGSDEIGESQQEPLQTIIRNGNHLLYIINELLDLSKIEEDKLQIERIDFSIVQLLQDVELLMSQQAENKGLEFKTNYSWPLPATIKSDPFRIKQVLLNLCSNAIKFTPHGYIHINISCQRDAELVSFEVIDTGIGVAHEQHDRIFQAFDQADVSTTRQYGGTGLGLSLSKRLSELLGGSIELASEPGRGSRFTITLPSGPLGNVEFISDLSKHKLPTTAEDKPAYTLLKGRILVADDAPDNRLLLSALLGKFGLESTIVENGQLALDTLADKEFDLILLDIQMPVLDGMQTLKKLQEQHYNKPVIALTANTLAEDRKLYLDTGFTDYIAKPIRLKILNKILSQYFEKA